MEWINPHAWIHMDVKGEDGKMVSWMVELDPPNALPRREKAVCRVVRHRCPG